MDSKVWIIISIAILACCGHAQGYGTEADDKDHPDEVLTHNVQRLWSIQMKIIAIYKPHWTKTKNPKVAKCDFSQSQLFQAN